MFSFTITLADQTPLSEVLNATLADHMRAGRVVFGAHGKPSPPAAPELYAALAEAQHAAPAPAKREVKPRGHVYKDTKVKLSLTPAAWAFLECEAQKQGRALSEVVKNHVARATLPACFDDASRLHLFELASKNRRGLVHRTLCFSPRTAGRIRAAYPGARISLGAFVSSLLTEYVAALSVAQNPWVVQ